MASSSMRGTHGFCAPIPRASRAGRRQASRCLAGTMAAAAVEAPSARLEEQDGHLAQVEVDEVLRLVRHVGPEVPAHDGVPGWVILLVELLLDEGGDVLLDVVLLERLRGTIDG